MNILFITENLPYPVDTGGKIRSYNIIRGLSRHNDVILLSTYTSEDQLGYADIFKQLCAQVHLVKKKKRSLARLAYIVLSNIFSRFPLLVKQHFNKSLSNKIRELIRDESLHIDAVHFDHLDSSVYLEQINDSTHKILDEHNIVTNQIITSYNVQKNPLLRLLLKSQISKTMRYEGNTASRMDMNLVCSSDDKRYLREFTDTANITVIPNGVDIEYFSQPQSTYPPGLPDLEKGKTLVFVGTLDYGPGETAVSYFLEEIFPLLQTEDKDFKFIAVGQNPSRRLLKMSSDNIIFTGRVDDIRPYVSAASIFVVPLLSGSGTRLKILDAMAMKIPVVSTSIGAEGLTVNHEKDIMLADSPEDFARSISLLCNNHELQNTLIDNGFKLVSDQYAWEIVWNSLDEVYGSLDKIIKEDSK